LTTTKLEYARRLPSPESWYKIGEREEGLEGYQSNQVRPIPFSHFGPS
jgi:hypothetical protein